MNAHAQSTAVQIPVRGAMLDGDLIVPDDPVGVVVFAHGSGSSRHSPRNQYVARMLHEKRLGTLLFDLLTAREEEEEQFTRHLRFDIPFLAGRLSAATSWLKDEQSPAAIGYFGSSTGAAAALIAAAAQPESIAAVVSRGGRPDLAGSALQFVQAPTLLIVGGDDFGVIDLNREAFAQLRCEKEFVTVPGATHLFTEAGSLEQVALLARDWFAKQFEGFHGNRPLS